MFAEVHVSPEGSAGGFPEATVLCQNCLSEPRCHLVVSLQSMDLVVN